MKNSSTFSKIIGSLVVDGLVQIGFTFWLSWILRRMFDFTFDIWLFWVGATFVYMAVHLFEPELSGRIFLSHLFILLTGTAFIFLFL
jgi:hypothetical protein